MASEPIKLPTKPTVDTLDERLNGMQEAVRLLQAAMDKMPTPALVQADVNALRALTAEQLRGLKEYLGEKLNGVDAILAERQTALDAAFKSSSAVALETKTTLGEQIAGTARLLESKTTALESVLHGVATRLTMVESRTTVTKEVSGDGRALLFALIGAVVGVGGLLFAFLK